MTQSKGDIPKKIDRYEILEAVGFGAMGAVYRAFDPLIKRAVAVKTIRLDVPPGSPDYRAFLERFTTEARTAGRLSHPNIITLYDVGHTSDQVPWLAMEFVDGDTVERLVEKGTLKPEVVVGLVSQIASAIDFAHGEGVIHRDIKPSNVIVYGGEKVKVTDFGIAKLMDGEITHSGFMMGTPSYMSPEQAMGEDLDGRTDIFSLGVVAFEMLSGTQPFPGNNVTSILYKLVHSDPVHPENLEVLGLLSEKWHEVFTRVLAKDPAARYPTAAEFVRDLELCLGSWFGALEGETVIVSDASAIASMRGEDASGESGDPGPSDVDSDEDRTVVLTGGADVSEDGGDATVIAAAEPPASSADASGAPADGVDAADDDETVLIAPPAVDPEATLAGPIEPPPTPALGEATVLVAPELELDAEHREDETLYERPPSGATRPALPLASNETPNRAPSTVTDRVRLSAAPGGPDRKTYLRSGALALGLLLAVASGFLVLRSRGDEVAPAPSLPAPSEAVPAPPPAAGTVSVSTEPDGARVLVDGEERGTTPLELADLGFGAHVILIERDGFRPETIDVELTAAKPDASYEIALAAVPAPPGPAFVRVTSDPDGARVEIDGREVGRTPIERLRVEAGDRRIRVLREGFAPFEDTLRARRGATSSLEAQLSPVPPPAPEPAPEPTPAPAPEPAVRVGELVERGAPGVNNPKCVSCPAVSYPEAAKRAGLSGVVELGYLIDENGSVVDLEIRQSGGEVFDEAVLETVSGWRYEPATKLGVRVKMRWIQRFRFQQGR